MGSGLVPKPVLYNNKTQEIVTKVSIKNYITYNVILLAQQSSTGKQLFYQHLSFIKFQTTVS